MPHFGLDPGLRPRPVRSAGLRAEPEQVGIAERNPTPGGRYDDRPWMDASPDREGTERHSRQLTNRLRRARLRHDRVDYG